MKRLILSLAVLSLIFTSGCAWDSTKKINHITYSKYEESGNMYTLIFKDDKGEQYKFLATNKRKINSLKEGELYNLEYYYQDWSSPDYALKNVEISNKKLEEENK